MYKQNEHFEIFFPKLFDRIHQKFTPSNLRLKEYKLVQMKVNASIPEEIVVENSKKTLKMFKNLFRKN